MPLNLPLPRNLSIRQESLFVKNNGIVGRLKPDGRGVYSGLPMMVLGEVTQQKTYYDPVSMADQITNPNSRFNMVLSQNKLYGEWGHPTFIGHGYSEADKIERLMTVDEKHTSHVFLSIYTDRQGVDGTQVLRADIKPTGVMGHVLKESLDDPMINTAFSLRAYVDTDVKPDGTKFRRTRSLVTFDAVNASGFFGTDKKHAIGLESFAGDQFHDYEIHVTENGNLMIDQIALETFNDTVLNEVFGTKDVAKISQSRTFVQVDKSVAERFPNAMRRGLFHDFFKD